jgi:hypothetical protein
MHIGMALLATAAFTASVIFWFATGNVLAPPATWLFIALIATCMNQEHVHTAAVPAALSAIAAMAAACALLAVWMRVSGLKKRKEANAYLSNHAATLTPLLRGKEEDTLEFSPEDLKRMRFLLDRALQPLAEFNGFEWLDQFQTAAVRYQIHFAGYALSMAQATHVPAFQGYLRQAQKRLIQKQTDHRIWKYWALENAWGNLRRDPDPVARENIMFSGFCATQMAMYHAASRRKDFDMTGSFSLRHPSGKVYVYDLPAIICELEAEARRSPFHLVACEPNWIYPLCNTITATAIRTEAPKAWASREVIFRRNLENEFMDLQGRFVPCRSRYTGLALPMIGGIMPQAMPCFFLNATIPDIALRQWLLLRRKILENSVFRRDGFWRIDSGNYRFSRAAAYAATALAAAEMGDEDIKALCLTALEEECPTKTLYSHVYRSEASVWAHAVEFFARSSVKNGFRDLMQNRPAVLTEPHVSSASYPDVLVARATYKDGLLRVILYPGSANNRQAIGISGLAPGVTYVCDGGLSSTMTADHTGNASIEVMLCGRKEVCVRKAA